MYGFYRYDAGPRPHIFIEFVLLITVKILNGRICGITRCEAHLCATCTLRHLTHQHAEFVKSGKHLQGFIKSLVRKQSLLDKFPPVMVDVILV